MLTDTQIRKSSAGPKAYKLADSHGLYVYVSTTGTKSFRYAYRFNGHWKVMTLGLYPLVSLQNARQKHQDARKLLTQGSNPIAASRQAQRTFQQAAEEWLKQWGTNKAYRTVFYAQRRLLLNVYPTMGSRSLTRITLADVRNCVQAIDHQGHPEMGKRVLMIVKQVMHWATVNGMLATNPISDLKPKDILTATTVRNYARIDANNLPDLLAAIETYRGTPVTRLAMKLMMLTFVRTSELIHSKWTEFDLPAAVWTIPAERMKMRRTHIVPLSTQALHVLDLLQGMSGKNGHLFPGDRHRDKPMSNNTILKALERMGYKGRMTGHGFRGLASTILHEQGFDSAWIETQLAHAPRNTVAAAYNHAQYLKQRTKMMQAWADYLDNVDIHSSTSGLLQTDDAN